jgi:acetylornithine deacetylase/succinyl-diaminopimelate desuccinylase-like protein
MKFLQFIDSKWIADKTHELVAIKSETLSEGEVCEFYASELESLGLVVERRLISNERFNIYAKLEGVSSQRSLILNGHLDTIPIGAAWPPRISTDKIFGRGAEDMKGGMAAVLAMLRAFKMSETKLQGDLWITAVVGHEDAEAEKDGPLAMCQDINSGKITGDAILIVEGDSELWAMSTGSTVFQIILRSKLGGTHTNNISISQNPIHFIGKIIAAIVELQDKMDLGEKHPLVGSPRVDLGKIISGDYYNRTPAVSTIEGIIRWLPGTTLSQTEALLHKIVYPIAQEGDLDVEIKFMLSREPFEVSEDNHALQIASSAVEKITGAKPKVIGKKIVGDANIFMPETGITTFYYGPGYKTAHSNEEWVSIAELSNLAKVLGNFAIDFLEEAN